MYVDAIFIQAMVQYHSISRRNTEDKTGSRNTSGFEGAGQDYKKINWQLPGVRCSNQIYRCKEVLFKC